MVAERPSPNLVASGHIGVVGTSIFVDFDGGEVIVAAADNTLIATFTDGGGGFTPWRRRSGLIRPFEHENRGAPTGAPFSIGRLASWRNTTADHLYDRAVPLGPVRPTSAHPLTRSEGLANIRGEDRPTTVGSQKPEIFASIAPGRGHRRIMESSSSAIRLTACQIDIMAEGEGFEPPGACAPTVFKTAAIDHSATLPAGTDIMLRQRTVQ